MFLQNATKSVRGKVVQLTFQIPAKQHCLLKNMKLLKTPTKLLQNCVFLGYFIHTDFTTVRLYIVTIPCTYITLTNVLSFEYILWL